MNNNDSFDNNQAININENNMNQNQFISNDDGNNDKQFGIKKDKLPDFIKKSSQPKIALITVSIKLLALFFFLFLNIFTSNEALVMIVVILLDAADFWYTKNISGRILVGLRWWNNYNQNTQENVWVFESKNEIKESNIDRKTFWFSLYGFAAIWLILFVWECILFNFIWAFLCLISLAIAGTNVYGFFRCSKIQQEKAALITAMIIKKVGKKK
jgi:hypothetical protein